MRTEIAEYAKNSQTQPKICNDLDFVCVNTEKPGYVFFFVSDVKINRYNIRNPLVRRFL